MAAAQEGSDSEDSNSHNTTFYIHYLLIITEHWA